MKKVLILSLLSILTTCQKLTKEENATLQSMCGTKTGLLLYNKKVQNGNQIIDIVEAPWVVSILMKAGHEAQCSGTLISQRHVLSARHCFVGSDAGEWRWTVTNLTWNNVDGCENDDLIIPAEMNEYFTYNFNTVCSDYACEKNNIIPKGTLTIKAKKVILPRICSSGRSSNWWNEYDLAIIELENNLTFSDDINPACLTKSAVDVKPGNKIWFAGYGADPKAEPETIGVLNYFDWNDIKACNTLDSRIGDNWLCSTILNQQMGCSGDSGGGLITTVNQSTTIVGVLSMATPCNTSNTEDIGVNFYVNLGRHIGDICRHTGVCVEYNFQIMHFSIFRTVVISIMRIYCIRLFF